MKVAVSAGGGGSEHIGTRRKRPANWALPACLGCVKLSPSKLGTLPPLAIAGTALFEKYHPWVNTAGILEACCVGRLAKPTPTLLSPRRRRWSASTAATGVAAPADVAAAPDRMGVEQRPRARVTWDEAGIQAHDAERGVRFGTMKIDQPDTPFLFLDADDPCGEMAAIHPKYLATHVPTAERTGAGPHRMHVKELQDALGLVTTDEDGLASFSRPKWSHSEGFEAQRQALYRDEARVAAISVGLPDGWAVLLSTSEPREPFYHHEESNLTQWERPV